MSLPPHGLEQAVSILPIIQCPGIPASMASDSSSSSTSSVDTSTMSWLSTPEKGCREDFSYPHILDRPKAKRDQSCFNCCLTIIQVLQAPLVDLQVFDSVTSTEFNKIMALSTENREYRISVKLVHLPHLNQLITMPPFMIHEIPIQQFTKCINLFSAFLVSIHEAKYTPPPKSIPLYTLQPIPSSAFALPTNTLSFGPVVVGGITWFSIDSITFKASLQCKDGQLRFEEGPLFTKGHLFPDLEMKGVDRLLDLAAQHFLQCIAEIMEGMPGVDASRVSQV
ncbi:hypothetical protein EV401DRAFT_2068526 [Pisolithus croceorrhizus]|nr:hypothetical protein EV401DRAFT_2068526 [Pisolithus croceorrhizus]